MLPIVQMGMQKEYPILEKDLWSMFHCLARGVTAMDRGSEDLAVDPWTRPEIGHFDMINDNSK